MASYVRGTSDVSISLLHNAVKTGERKSLTKLIKEGCDPYIEDENGANVLHTACLHGKYFIVRDLSEDYSELINKVDNYGDTCLHYAAAGGNKAVFEFLEQNANLRKDLIHQRNKDGESALHKACLYDKYDIVHHLVANLANLEATSGTNDWNILHYAAASGNINILQKFLDRIAVCPTMVPVEKCFTKDGKTVLHIACMYRKYDMVVHLLQNFPMLKNKTDINGFTLLHAAASAGDVEIFKFLEGEGLDYNKVTKNGWTILHVACIKCNNEIMRHIAESYPSLTIAEDKNGLLAIQFISADSCTKDLKLLACQGMNIACSEGHDKMVRYHNKICSQLTRIQFTEQYIIQEERDILEESTHLPDASFSNGLTRRKEEINPVSFILPQEPIHTQVLRLKESESSRSSGYLSRESSTKSQTHPELSVGVSSSTREISFTSEETLWPENIIPSIVRTCITGKGKESQEVACLLQWLCMRAKTRLDHHSQADVSPGYHMNKSDEPVLLAIVSNEPENAPDTSDSFTLVVRKEDEVSPEGKYVVAMEMEKNLHFTEEERVKLHNFFNENSKNLMAKHSNLEVISASKIKSKRYGKENAEVKEETCIVLYVPVKGIIPFQEEPFPEEIGGFTVDVREGLFEPHTLPSGYHEKLVMGCQIASGYGKCGTLGGFVELENGNIGGLTCLHIFLPQESREELQRTRRLSHGSFKREVYQPDNSRDKLKFGIVKKEIFDPGDEEDSIGVDAVLIEITDPDRLPISGKFPNATSEIAGFTEKQPMAFNSGKVIGGFSEVQIPCTVVKYGKSTQHTMGMLRLEGPAVHKRKYRYLMDDNSSEVFELSNQFEIFHMNDQPFSAPGDSGALVFIVSLHGETHDIRALGMIVGGTSHNTTIVTPIWAVLDKLELPRKLLRFSSSTNCAGTQTSGTLLSAIESDPAFKQLKEEVSELRTVTSTIHKELEENTKTIGIVGEKLDDVKRSVDSKIDDLKTVLLQAMSQKK